MTYAYAVVDENQEGWNSPVSCHHTAMAARKAADSLNKNPNYCYAAVKWGAPRWAKEITGRGQLQLA